MMRQEVAGGGGGESDNGQHRSADANYGADGALVTLTAAPKGTRQFQAVLRGHTATFTYNGQMTDAYELVWCVKLCNEERHFTYRQWEDHGAVWAGQVTGRDSER